MTLRLAIAFAALWAPDAVAEEVMTLQWEAGVIPITPTDLVGAEATGPMVTVQLEPVLARKFADLTELLIGETVAILLCGRELARPEVRERISGGVLAFDTGHRARDAAAVLTGQAGCDGFWNAP